MKKAKDNEYTAEPTRGGKDAGEKKSRADYYVVKSGRTYETKSEAWAAIAASSKGKPSSSMSDCKTQSPSSKEGKDGCCIS